MRGDVGAFIKVSKPMPATDNRPENINERGQDRSTGTGTNPGSLAAYIIAAPPTADWPDIYEAWQSGMDPRDQWNQEVAGHTVARRRVYVDGRERWFFECNQCGELAESQKGFREFDCQEGSHD